MPSINYTTFVGNTVNPDQAIGVLSIQNQDKIGAGVFCSDNKPAAVIGTKPCPAK